MGKEQQLTKRERRQLRREERRREAERGKQTQGAKSFFIWGIVLAVLGLGGFGVFRYLSSGSGNVAGNILDTCVTHSGGMHIHPNLKIVISGEIQEIPRNIGISSTCMRPIHTHDTSRKIHIEFPREYDFVVGDFFKAWDKQFSRTQIFEYLSDAAHTVSMTVNGEENSEFENYVMKDGNDIVIEYSEIVLEQSVEEATTTAE